MRIVATVARLAAAVAAGVLIAAGSVSPANAAAPLSVTLVGCGGSGGIYLCGARWTGAVAPVSIRWFMDGNPVPAFNDRSYLLDTCTIGAVNLFRVVVTDSTGASDDDSKLAECTLL